MMKRYASHFLFLPGYGYLKQYAIEMEGDCMKHILPLTEEIESTEWLPGVIALLCHSEQSEETTTFDTTLILSSVPESIKEKLPSLTPYLFSPFDFTTMQPVAGTQRRQLR